MTDKKRAPLWTALGLAWEFGYMIAVPLVLLALAGRWLDMKFHTSPWLLLAGMLLAIIFTTVMMVRKFSRLLKDLDQPPPKKPDA